MIKQGCIKSMLKDVNLIVILCPILIYLNIGATNWYSYFCSGECASGYVYLNKIVIFLPNIFLNEHDSP